MLMREFLKGLGLAVSESAFVVREFCERWLLGSCEDVEVEVSDKNGNTSVRTVKRFKMIDLLMPDGRVVQVAEYGLTRGGSLDATKFEIDVETDIDLGSVSKDLKEELKVGDVKHEDVEESDEESRVYNVALSMRRGLFRNHAKAKIKVTLEMRDAAEATNKIRDNLNKDIEGQLDGVNLSRAVGYGNGIVQNGQDGQNIEDGQSGRDT